MKRVRSMSCSQIAEAVGERTEPPYRGRGSLSLLSGQDRSLVDKAIASIEGKISAGRTTKPRFLCYICKTNGLSGNANRGPDRNNLSVKPNM